MAAPRSGSGPLPRADPGGLLPELPGVLSGDAVRTTVAWIASQQDADGALPWLTDGQLDPWDSVEAAMALDLGGEHDRARAAYRWLADRQRPDGSWAAEYRAGRESAPATESNHAGYLAVGAWHSWLLTRDEELVVDLWPAVRAGLDLVTRMQLPGGAIGWALRPDGTPDGTALLTGNSSLFQALRCGIALAGLVGETQPDWELAVTDLGTALRTRPGDFADRSRYSMDWYYPVLGGAVTGAAANDRLAADWDRFVVPGLGARCVADRPWVTGAETCELALALAAAGQADAAVEQVAAMQHLRHDDGSYWTGYVFADDARWPVERTTWTAGAVVLAADAISGASAASGLFPDPAALPAAGMADVDDSTADWLAG
ncbi:prenyltransferase/squalene oxidase repeat-containing protein [Blastococcus sp. CT_GayMR16]|uniref:prenyltransferase/squalene oxidase repeat-containing protein n=1 Tax=Blastococcus sp. CT_GayMR16 TaxID=2559607 RepID=UPI0010737895|nr:prenyltransferase/squalene oxidase repeat-containing protein [Blastococcus sp. CT_GayMR16]TFV88487.1 prenyltransferase [Blastococcus sp. CT_GayMR16]